MRKTFHLQLQSKSSDLKRPQFEFGCAIRPLQLLAVILQQVGSAALLHAEGAFQQASALPAQALVDPHDDAAALALGEVAAGDVLVVFAALDGVEDERGGAREDDGVEEGADGCEGGWGWGRIGLHRVVEVVGCADGAGIQGTGVGENGIADLVSSCRCVNFDGGRAY